MIVRFQGPCVMVSCFFLVSALAGNAAASPTDQASGQMTTETSSSAPVSIDGIRQLIRDGEYAKAEQDARELLMQTERDSGADSPEVAEALVFLAQALWRGGNVMADETLSVAQRAVAINEAAVGPHDVRLADSLAELSNVYQERGEFAEARPLLERALAIYEASVGPNDSSVADVHTNLGILCYRLVDAGGGRGPPPNGLADLRDERAARRASTSPRSLLSLGATLSAPGPFRRGRDRLPSGAPDPGRGPRAESTPRSLRHPQQPRLLTSRSPNTSWRGPSSNGPWRSVRSCLSPEHP